MIENKNMSEKIAAAIEINKQREAARDMQHLEAALELLLDDLTESNAHTLAAMLEGHYRTGYDGDKLLKAYKAAQLELFGTR